MRWKVRAALIVAVSYVAVTVVLLGTFVSWRDRLPDPMASHFGGGGQADDVMSRAAWFWMSGLVMLLIGAMFLAMTWWGRNHGSHGRVLVSVAVAIGVALASLLTFAQAANLDAASAEEVVMPLWHLGVGAGLALVAGLLCWWITGPDSTPALEGSTATPEEPLRLGKGEIAVWTRTVGSWALGVVTALAVAVGALLAASGVWVAAVALLLSALPAAALSRLNVTVDGRGLAVAPPGLRRPAKRIGLDEVDTAGVRHVSAFADFGGWGYRVRPGASGVVMRSGQALSVRLRGGKEFVVVVDGAEEAAALLNGLVERRREEGE
ncbi:DUF1648 domain-containing protein [Streptomyces sp. SM12]|uniref:DUF1648 domain-containing protein n=1 Tax=Streptomyces sp. SM12 TaxID=1071602 RepID=UPI000CD501CD|nr:DUF1648 domain-containing protein [Streptomyces sp. SM12]